MKKQEFLGQLWVVVEYGVLQQMLLETAVVVDVVVAVALLPRVLPWALLVLLVECLSLFQGPVGLPAHQGLKL